MNLLFALFIAVAVICTLIHEAVADAGAASGPYSSVRLSAVVECSSDDSSDSVDAALDWL